MFIGGMALQRLHVRIVRVQRAQDEDGGAHRTSGLAVKTVDALVRWGAPTALGCIFLVFWFGLPFRFYLIWWHGGLMPLHALLILGLAVGEDPVTSLFARAPFVFLGDLSYAIYILQVATQWVTEDACGYLNMWIPGMFQSLALFVHPLRPFEVIYPVLLFVIAYVGRLVAQRPADKLYAWCNSGPSPGKTAKAPEAEAPGSPGVVLEQKLHEAWVQAPAASA